MESEALRRKIEETLIEILRNADLETTTEYGVRTTVAERLRIDLSDLDHKRLVRRVVESFLLSAPAEEKVQEETKEVVEEQPETSPNEIRDDGGRVLCKLSNKRSVSIQKFRERTLVSIRDYYLKDGKQCPPRGITLTARQWTTFRNSVPAIEEAIMKMESRIRSKGDGKHIEADVSSLTAFAPQEHIPIERGQIEANMSNSITAFAPQEHIPIEGEQIEAKANMSNSTSTCALQGHIIERKQTEADTSKSVTAHNTVTISFSQPLVPIATTRLKGKNYHCWMHQMEFFLKQLKIAYVLTEPCPSIPLQEEASFEEIIQAKSAARKWVDDDYICCHNILNSLSDHLFDQYSKRSYGAKELWEELKSVYDEDFGTKRSLVHKYIHFEMVDGTSVLEQVQELHNIADSIIASGMRVDEDFHVSVIISKLPPSWKEYRVMLMNKEFLPLNKLMYCLRVEEESRNCYKKEEPSTNTCEVGSNLENRVGPRKSESKRLCYTCGKEGHISKYCHHRKFDGTLA